MNIEMKLYEKMYLIRKTEEIIKEEFLRGEIKNPVHMSTGEEAIVAGICQALGNRGQYFQSYRNRGLYLALAGPNDTESIVELFAELFGRRGKIAGGKAGAMHLTAPWLGLLSTSAIVGSTIPVAVGAAFANKISKNGKIVVCFFGDGAINEGVFWESLNAACLWKLPIIFVCEDNDYAALTKTDLRQGYKKLDKIVSQFNCQCLSPEGYTKNVFLVYSMLKEAVGKIDALDQPFFFCFKYFRYFEHVGIKTDLETSYRPASDYQDWPAADPVAFARSRLLIIPSLEDIESKIEMRIRTALKKAKQRGKTPESDLFKGVIYE